MSVINKIHNMLSSKEISCKELTVKYLEEIEKSNKELNAYVTVTADVALSQAEKVDEKISKGEEIGLLEGVPVTLKDNLSTKDIETTCCSKMLKGYKPIYNATVWETLQGKGSVLLGKTNMDEFAMGSSCETSCFGGAKNPFNTSYCAGGSSGGGASAVSGNIAPYALGSDTGGSIRQPASFCGVVGLKPTYGAVSRYGLIAYASSLDQIGPITKTVEDASIVFDAISDYDTKDSTCSGRKESTYININNDIKGVRIGVVKEYIEGVSEEIKNELAKAIKVLEGLGAQIVYFDMPLIKYALPAYYIIACAEASSNLGRYDGVRFGYKAKHYKGTHDMMCRSRSEGFGEEVKKRILLGTYVLSAGYYDAYYKKAQNIRGAIIKEFENAFEKCDVILAPTVPTTAFESGKAILNSVETYHTDICTVPVNIAGLPSVSIPCGFDSKGLPVGMQLIGNKFQESVILNVANLYEKVADYNFKDTKWGVKL